MKLNKKTTKAMNKLAFKVKQNSPTILTCIASVGVIAVAVLSAKAAPKAVKIVEEEKQKRGIECSSTKESIAYNIKFGWKPYIPVVVTAASTIVCIFSANSLSKKQQAALTSAYMMLESSYKEYRNKVKDIYGEEADKEIINAIVKEKLVDTKWNSFNENDEKLLFFEPHHDSFFELTLADVQNAFYCVNRNFQLRGFSTLNELYEFLGIEEIPSGDYIGWSCDAYIEDGLAPWIDFVLEDAELDDGLKYYIISFDGFWNEPSMKAIEDWL